MSPRVRSIQFFDTICAMTTMPSVHITNEVSRSRSAGMPSGNATSPATSPATRKFTRNGVPKWIDMRADAYAPSPKNTPCASDSMPV